MLLAKKKVLVTGGAGFIGSEVVRQLVAKDAHVTVVDNLVNGKRANLDGLNPRQVTICVEDIRDGNAMRRLLQGVSVVLHLACLGVRHSIHSPRENHQVNAEGTLDLLLAAREAGVERFIYVSSSEVYGTAIQAPMDENHPTFPMTVYGAAKLAGEAYTRAFFRTYDFPTVVVRPFNTFGPRCHHEGDSGEVIPRFLLRGMAGRPLIIFGDGTQTRDFTCVSDTARGIILAAESDKAIGRTINLGQGREISINDLVRKVSQVLGRNDLRVEHSKPRPGDTLRLYADTRLAEELLGYRAEVPLAEGLQNLLNWYLVQGTSPEKLLEEEIELNWQMKKERSNA